MKIGVLIPTFRRHAALERALESVLNQSRLPQKIVVADNAPEGCAQALVERLGKRAPCPVTYVHIPEPGVANARNGGFAACDGLDYVAQLDDDESADPGWIAALECAANQTGAQVVFGPVIANSEGAGPVRSAWLNRLYARTPEHSDGLITKPYGCGNSLIALNGADLPNPVFDSAANEIGGEDDRLFSIMKQTGARFAWASEAKVVEHIEAGRGHWSALFRRAFAFGQGPSQDAAANKEMLRLAFWILIGAGQAVVFGLAALLGRLVSADLCAAFVDRSVQGLGKVFWMDRFAPRFYGAALQSRTS